MYLRTILSNSRAQELSDRTLLSQTNKFVNSSVHINLHCVVHTLYDSDDACPDAFNVPFDRH